jgi:predicted 2-oxoglutarate/Fe(II)-dependent dioxygenase YbiX
MKDAAYRHERARMQDYIIVTYYVENTGMLPKHQDYSGNSPYPLLQSLVLLSEPSKDFEGGDFVLYTKSGKTLSLARDIQAGMGDLFLFDKSLFHHVETTKRGHGSNRGRWSVLIGARAARDTWMQAAKKKLRYGPMLYPVRNLYNRGLSQSQNAALRPTG